MSELLDQLIAATAHSLERANEILADSARGDVSYIVTDLDVSIPFGGLAIEKDAVIVRLPDDDQPKEGAHYVRFSVRSVPQTQEKQAASAQGIPDVTNKDVSVGLTALARAGVPQESIRVRFDPKSKLPPGSITKVATATSSGRTHERITLTVAGTEPRRDKPKGRANRPAPSDTPLEQVRGIGPRLAAQLGTVGIRSVEDLAAAKPEEVAGPLSVSLPRAARYVEAARALMR